MLYMCSISRNKTLVQLNKNFSLTWKQKVLFKFSLMNLFCKRCRHVGVLLEEFSLRQDRIKFTNALLLQEVALIFRSSCEHRFTSSNFTLVAHPSATNQSILYPSYCGFFRPDVPRQSCRSYTTQDEKGIECGRMLQRRDRGYIVPRA